MREREFYTGVCMVLFKMITLASVVLKGKIKWEEITQAGGFYSSQGETQVVGTGLLAEEIERSDYFQCILKEKEMDFLVDWL